MERSDGLADTYDDGEYSLCDDQLVTMLVDAGIGRDDIAAVQRGLNVLWSADGSLSSLDLARVEAWGVSAASARALMTLSLIHI